MKQTDWKETKEGISEAAQVLGKAFKNLGIGIENGLEAFRETMKEVKEKAE